MQRWQGVVAVAAISAVYGGVSIGGEGIAKVVRVLRAPVLAAEHSS